MVANVALVQTARSKLIVRGVLPVKLNPSKRP
jgi:hypothetical protein